MKTKLLLEKYGTTKVLGLMLISLQCLYHANGWASENKQQDQYKKKPFSLGIGAGYVRFDTNFRFTDKDSGLSVFVDGEGTLGLPEKQGVPLFYGHYRFGKRQRHGIGFSYFRVNREATLFQLDEQKDFNLGDITITAGAQAKLTLTDRTAFYHVSYNYTLFDDNRNVVFASFGVNGLDLKYIIHAEGEIAVQGETLVEDSFTREAEVFAPLPMFGIDAWSNFTRKWALGTKISLVGGTYQDINALVVDTSVRAKFQFNKWIGVTFGITYFNAEVVLDETGQKSEIDYGFDGISLGINMNL